MISSDGVKLGKDNVNYNGLIDDLKGAKTIITDDNKFFGALIKEINRILYKAVA